MEEFPAYLDDHPFQVMERIRSEKKHGIRTADVVLMPHYAVMALDREKLIDRYRPEGASSVPPNMRPDRTRATPVGATFMAMAYDSRSLLTAELPSGIEDLKGSKWKGRLGAQSFTASRSGNLGAWYLSHLREEVGEDAWTDFVESLAKTQRPTTFDCIDHLLQGLLEGQVQLALTVYSLAYFREKTSGSTVALVPDNVIPHMMTFTSAGIVSGAEEPETATRFIDFLLSGKGQRIIGQIPGIAPVRKGSEASYDFEHKVGPRTKFYPKPEDFDSLEKSLKLFRRLNLP